MNCDIKLYDRVKQTSQSTGTGDFSLNNSVTGFKNFSDVYSHQDVLFYCINDGTSFEVGSGIFNTGTTPFIQRHCFYSSQSDNTPVSFGNGTKEVFVTYPATHAVSIGSGIAGVSVPQQSGIAFWDCAKILDYDNNFIWDKANNRLGIRNPSPSYTIDVGGDGTSSQSMIRASGYHAGNQGIHFPSGNGSDASYVGGAQYQHFVKNEILGTAQSVLGTSGVVNQQLYFKNQSQGLFFAGPTSGCAGACPPAYPNFRPITKEDVPFLLEISGNLTSDIAAVSNVATNNIATSGYLRGFIDINTASSGHLQSQIINPTNFTALSGIAQDAFDASGTLRSDLTNVSGIAQDAFNASGTLTSTIASASGTLNSDILEVSGLLPDTISIYDLGDITGSTNIDWSSTKQVQTARFTGGSISLNKGTGWTTLSNQSSDVFLVMSGIAPTSVTFPIVDNRFYNKPTPVLQAGEHNFIFRSFGTKINGYYVGSGVAQ